MSDSEFAGFPAQMVDFLSALKNNNNREWFSSHKSDYEDYFQKPANHFCDVLRGKLLALNDYEHRSKIYRLHRDLRFSRDKTPYNCHLHISLIPEVTSNGTPPCWFFGYEPGQLTVGAGMIGFEKNALEKYRERVDTVGKELVSILDSLEDDGFRLDDVELKRVPKPFAQDHAYAALLKRKGMTAWYDFADPAVVCNPALVRQCIERFAQLQPLFNWLLALEQQL